MGDTVLRVFGKFPPIWPGLVSHTQDLIWVEFEHNLQIGSCLCSKRIFSGYSSFHFLKNQHFQIPIQSGVSPISALCLIHDNNLIFACNFLLHFRLTAYSLYAAVSVGLQVKKLITTNFTVMTPSSAECRLSTCSSIIFLCSEKT